jgi:phosphatidylglycerol:prolipoprotein diacylglycerol transferase
MPSFSLFIGLGSLAGLMMTGWRAPKNQTLRYVDAGILALFMALVGGRGVFAAVNWGYYAHHFLEIFEVWQGGLSGMGAMAGGALAVLILAIGWQFPAGLLADSLLPLAGSVSITAWLGCWVSGSAYGLPSTSWWALLGKDEWGVVALRLPVQLIGASATLLFIWLIDGFSRRLKTPGVAANIGMFSLSGIIFCLSFLRADPTPIWNGLRLEGWGGIGGMTLSAIAVVVLLVRRNRDRPPSPIEKIP